MSENGFNKYELHEIVERVIQEYQEYTQRDRMTQECSNAVYMDILKDGVFALQSAIEQWLDDNE